MLSRSITRLYSERSRLGSQTRVIFQGETDGGTCVMSSNETLWPENKRHSPGAILTTHVRDVAVVVGKVWIAGALG